MDDNEDPSYTPQGYKLAGMPWEIIHKSVYHEVAADTKDLASGNKFREWLVPVPVPVKASTKRTKARSPPTLRRKLGLGLNDEDPRLLRPRFYLLNSETLAAHC